MRDRPALPEDDVPILVQCHCGSRCDEYPIRLVMDGKDLPVREILDRWVESDAAGGRRFRCFFVKVGTGRAVRICQNEMSGCWYLRKG